VRELLLTPGIHKKFEAANGEAAIAGLRVLLKLHHAPHPWDDLRRAIAVELLAESRLVMLSFCGGSYFSR
jgi:hypothetical protein